MKMAFLRSVATTTAIAVASAIPVTLELTSLSSSSSSSSPSFRFTKPQTLSFLSSAAQSLNANRSGFVTSFVQSPSFIHMDSPTSGQKPSFQSDAAALPELLTEYMVDMKCDGCVNSVKNKLQTVEGVKSVEADLNSQVVRILGSTPLKTDRKARLIGQGIPEDFLVPAAVAEFKGPEIFGVVRLAQVNMELARIEANFSGLPPGKHGWSINEYGSLTEGAASTGKVFNPSTEEENEPLGDLGTLDTDEKGNAFFSGVKQKLRVAELLGRALVVYGTADKSDSGVSAAVIARSAGVGENYKKLCTCDGTTIWE